MSTQGDYHAYLLRLWLADNQWRASLENAHSAERHSFASIDALLTFLRTTTGQAEKQPQTLTTS